MAQNPSDLFAIDPNMPPALAEQALAAQRRQQVAQALLSQSQEPIQAPQSKGRFETPISPLAGIAKVVQAFIAKSAQSDADAKRLDVTNKYHEGLAGAVKDYVTRSQGTPEIPGTPAIPGTTATSAVPDPSGDIGAAQVDQPATSGVPATAGVPAVPPQDARTRIANALSSPYAPIRALGQAEMAAMLKHQGESPFAKIDPSKFTPESVQAYMGSGGKNYSLLKPTEKLMAVPQGDKTSLVGNISGVPVGAPLPMGVNPSTAATIKQAQQHWENLSADQRQQLAIEGAKLGISGQQLALQQFGAALKAGEQNFTTGGNIQPPAVAIPAVPGIAPTAAAAAPAAPGLPPAPPPSSDDLLRQATGKYGFINNLNPIVINSPQENGDYAETWPIGEEGDAKFPRPKEIPIDRHGVQIFRPGKFSADDLAGEMLHIDPRARQTSQALLKSLTPAQIAKVKSNTLDYQQDNSSEEAKMRSGVDSVMRGYVVGQWPQRAIDDFGFSPQQKALLDGLKSYTQAQSGGMPTQPIPGMANTSRPPALVIPPQVQAARNSDQVRILQNERAQQTDPQQIAMIDQEIAKLSGGAPFKQAAPGRGSPVPGAVAAPTFPSTPGNTPQTDAAAALDLKKKTQDMQAKRNFNMAGIGSTIDEARRLLSGGAGVSPTSSGIGTAVDYAGSLVGHATKGSAQADQLRSLAGSLTAKVPRMEGPQSDRDVQLYRESAGQVGDSTLPIARRLAALQTVEQLFRKYDTAASPRRRAGDTPGASGGWGDGWSIKPVP